MAAPNSYASLLLSAAYRLGAWKNGGGETAEIAIQPPSATLAKGDFQWRLSSARVKKAGPFSEFPGFERLLTVVGGKEMVLRGSDQLVALPAGEVFGFAGTEAFSADLPQGPVEDLGIIFRPETCAVKMSVLDFQKKPRSFELHPSSTNFFFVAQGEFLAEAYPGELTFPLKERDALRLEPVAGGKRIVLLQPTNKGKARVVAIEIISKEP